MDTARVVEVRYLKKSFRGDKGLFNVGESAAINIGAYSPNVHKFLNPEDKKEWEAWDAKNREAERLKTLSENSNGKEVEVLRAENSALAAKLKELEAKFASISPAEKPAPEKGAKKRVL